MATNEEEPQLEDRVERLEAGQTSIIAKLDQLIGTGSPAHAKAQAHEEAHLDRPSTVEEMVRQELERKDREAAAKADKDAEKSEREQIKAQVAKLTESKPVAPQPRRQRIMWGPR